MICFYSFFLLFYVLFLFYSGFTAHKHAYMVVWSEHYIINEGPDGNIPPTTMHLSIYCPSGGGAAAGIHGALDRRPKYIL